MEAVSLIAERTLLARHTLSFVCPRCHGPMRAAEREYRCDACSALYPVVLGIPDFRVAPDPWIGLEEDRDKARRLAALVEGRSFEDAVRAYWDITPGTPRPMAERFTRHVLDAEARADEWLEWLDRVEGRAPAGGWLDVGCGTGDLIAAASRRGIAVMGVDIALRWLVVAACRPGLAGHRDRLVCANAEHLPFADASFVRAVSLGTLEHCADAGRVTAECRRVLRRGGVVRIRTVNRYSLLGEPHVGVWGVGFVPRAFADRFVRWRSGQRYLHHRPLSPRELRLAFRGAGFSGVRVSAAPMLAADRARLGRGRSARWAAPLYEGLRRIPLVRGMIRWAAPLLDARGAVA